MSQGALRDGKKFLTAGNPRDISQLRPPLVSLARQFDTGKHYNFSGNYKSTKTQGKRQSGPPRSPNVFFFAFQHSGIRV
jgi:hypothetical protein